MYGEMAHLRARASALRSLAVEIRARASALLRQSESLGWSSTAAEALRVHIRSVANDLGAHAVVIDDAADALDQHARAVDDVKYSIARAQAWSTSRWHEAMTLVRTVGAAVGSVAQGQVERAIAIVTAVPKTPVPGSAEWLAVRTAFERSGWA